MKSGYTNSQRLSLYSILLLLALLAATFPSCSKDDDKEEENITEPIAVNHSKKQIMMVFGPSRLGDRGLADDMLSNLYAIPSRIDSVEVDFICETSIAATQTKILDWANDNMGPVYHERYDSRLLILTENYMLSWLNQLVDQLQPTDEVLQLNVNEDDLNSTAACQQLGIRLHGANISAAHSIRRFCKFMDFIAGTAEARGNQHICTDTIFFIRPYEGSHVFYRDSIDETLSDVRGEHFHKTHDNIFVIEDDEKWGNGEIYSPYGQTLSESISFVSWSIALMGCMFPFCLLDLGTATNGIDYQLLNTSHDYPFYVIILDGSEILTSSNERYYISRDYGRVIYDWGIEWAGKPFGSMPHWEIHGGWDGYCKDNFYGI